MRTTAEPQRPVGPARGAGPGAARRRPPGAPSEPGAAAAAPSRQAEAAPVVVTATRLVRVDEGLYALRVGEIDGTPTAVGGLTVPLAHVSAPFAEDGNGVEIVASFPRRGPWLGKEGGTRDPALAGDRRLCDRHGIRRRGARDRRVVARPAAPRHGLDRLEAPGVLVEASGHAAALTGARDIPTEIMLHIERAGDRLFPGRGWVGALGRKMRIEAFSIRPLEQLAPADIEMKGFLPDGGETPWVPGGALCGTRGRGLPLTGFAVRVASQRADRFDVQYQGSFFIGGISETRRNGDPVPHDDRQRRAGSDQCPAGRAHPRTGIDRRRSRSRNRRRRVRLPVRLAQTRSARAVNQSCHGQR